MDDVDRIVALVKHLEAEMLKHVEHFIDNPSGSIKTSHRTAAAECATVLLAVRARLAEVQS